MVDEKLKDAALMARVAAGDRHAQRVLVDRHLGPGFSLAVSMLRDRALAEDMCQEAFFRLWKIARKWQPQAKIGTWLYRVIHNLCIDELRRRGRLSDDEVPEVADETPDPMQQHHRAQVADTVRQELDRLPVRQRTAIALVHYQELSNIEAAEIMEISVDALESLLARGRRKLRETLMERKADLMEVL